jgi:hypothetical protein
VPDDRILCPGVIEPQSNYIEHPELVAQRILRYANLVGRPTGHGRRGTAASACTWPRHAGHRAARALVNDVAEISEAADPDRAQARADGLADQFIMDTHTHFLPDVTQPRMRGAIMGTLIREPGR